MANQEVKVKISVDNQQAEDAIRKTKTSFSDIQKGAKEFALGATAVSGGLTAFVGAALDGAAKAEQLQVAFTTMTGSADVAKQTLASLTNFAATTPFNLVEVQEASKKLLAFGVAAQDIEPTLRKLGDVSAGIGAPLGEIAYLFGTIKTQGVAMTQDIRQFASRGIPIYEALAEVMDTNVESVGELISAGKIGFPEVEAAFTEMTKEGSKFGGLMAEQSKTFGGAVSNIEDSIGQLLVAMGQSLLPMAKDVAASISGLLTVFQNLDPGTKETIVQAIALAAALAGIGAAVAAIIAIVNPFTIAMALIVGAFVLIKTYGQDILNFFTYWGGELINSVSTALAPLIGAITGFGQQIQAVWGQVWDWVMAKWNEAAGYLAPALSDFASAIGEVMNLIFGTVTNIWNSIVGVFTWAWGNIQSGTDEGTNYLEVAWDTIANIFSSAWETIKFVFDVAWTAITGGISIALETISGIIKTVLSIIKGDWSGAWEAMKATFTNVWNTLLAIGQNILNTIKEFIKKKLADIGIDFDQSMATLTAMWSGFWDSLQGVVDTVVNAIQATINRIWDAINNVIKGLSIMIQKAQDAANAVGGFLGFGGARAAGGPVTSGTTYLVGEHGPELFTPTTNGNITPNHKLGGGGGSSVVININGIVSSREVAEEYANQIVRQLQLSSAVI